MYKPDVSFKILSKPWDKPELLTKFTQNPILKSSIKPNPVLEEMLDEAILKRSIPLHSTEFTMNVIKSKYPNLSDDVKECLEILKTDCYAVHGHIAENENIELTPEIEEEIQENPPKRKKKILGKVIYFTLMAAFVGVFVYCAIYITNYVVGSSENNKNYTSLAERVDALRDQNANADTSGGELPPGLVGGEDADESYILPEYRRRGIAAKLFAEVESWAKEQGAIRMELHTWDFNKGAIAMYEAMGMTPQRYVFEKKL